MGMSKMYRLGALPARKSPTGPTKFSKPGNPVSKWPRHILSKRNQHLLGVPFWVSIPLCGSIGIPSRCRSGSSSRTTDPASDGSVAYSLANSSDPQDGRGLDRIWGVDASGQRITVGLHIETRTRSASEGCLCAWVALPSIPLVL